MGGMIFFNQDEAKVGLENRWASAYVNSNYWDAFGDLLDEVFLPDYQVLQESIKPEEGEYLKFYTFESLSQEDFNLSVKLIRKHLEGLTPDNWKPREYINDMAKWQDMARQVWEEIAEPYIILDSRYDIKLIQDN